MTAASAFQCPRCCATFYGADLAALLELAVAHMAGCESWPPERPDILLDLGVSP